MHFTSTPIDGERRRHSLNHGAPDRITCPAPCAPHARYKYATQHSLVHTLSNAPPLAGHAACLPSRRTRAALRAISGANPGEPNKTTMHLSRPGWEPASARGGAHCNRGNLPQESSSKKTRCQIVNSLRARGITKLVRNLYETCTKLVTNTSETAKLITF